MTRQHRNTRVTAGRTLIRRYVLTRPQARAGDEAAVTAASVPPLGGGPGGHGSAAAHAFTLVLQTEIVITTHGRASWRRARSSRSAAPPPTAYPAASSPPTAAPSGAGVVAPCRAIHIQWCSPRPGRCDSLASSFASGGKAPAAIL